MTDAPSLSSGTAFWTESHVPRTLVPKFCS